MFIFEREREWAEEGQRKREAQNLTRALCWARTHNCKIMTWAEVRCLIDWATQMAPSLYMSKPLFHLLHQLVLLCCVLDNICPTFLLPSCLSNHVQSAVIQPIYWIFTSCYFIFHFCFVLLKSTGSLFIVVGYILFPLNIISKLFQIHCLIISIPEAFANLFFFLFNSASQCLVSLHVCWFSFTW